MLNTQKAMLEAVEHQKAGRWTEAEAVCRQVLDADPRRSDALQLLGIIAWREKRHQDALDLIGRAIEINPSQPQFHGNLGLVLVDMGKLDEAIAAFTRSLMLRPKSAKTHNDVGNALVAKGMTEQAAESFRQALAITPDFPEALFNLGNTLRKQGQVDEAMTYYRKALAARPGWAEAHNNLGNSLSRLGRMDEAIAAYRTALAQMPESAEMHNNLGSAYMAKGDLDRAMTFFQSALQLQENHPSAHWNMGLIHLLRGEFEEGWPLYEWRARVPGLGINARLHPPAWDGTDLGGRRILIHHEQGLGDVIQFIRYLPMVAERNGRIVLACHPALHRLLRGVGREYGEWASLIEEWAAPDGDFPEYEVHCPLMSLPHVFRTNLTNIPAPNPYVWADDVLADQWRRRLQGSAERKIGIAWAGSAVHPNDRNRSFPLSTLAALGQVANVRWVSLQTGEPARQAATAPFALTDWSGDLTDFADTAALVANLDLVISADTAVVHLAAAMGKPVWVLLPKAPDWRWMREREDSPWYPTIRFFRQEVAGDWTTPVSRIVSAAEALPSALNSQ